jgi:hypothetical protein
MSNMTQQIKNQLKTESMRPIHQAKCYVKSF